MATIQERVATLEERIKPLAGAHGLRNVIVGAIITALLGWMWYVTVSIIAMKQQLADGGNKQLVSELKSPKSPEQLRANLTTVIAQVQTARANQTQPNPGKIQALDGAVSQVLKQDQGLSEGWEAAGELISYRAQVSGSPRYGNCVTQPWSQTYASGSANEDDAPNLPIGAIRVSAIKFHDCTLVLDDTSAFEISEADRWAARPTRRRKVIALELHNVHVIYRGGVVVPVDSILFDNCSFEFQTLSLPTVPGQMVTQSLLAAADIRNVAVKLSS